MLRAVGWFMVFVLGLTGCSRVWTARFGQRMDVDVTAPFVKCHLADGGLYVLTSWHLERDAIQGYGYQYDADRRRLTAAQDQRVPLEEVVLIETNRPEELRHAGVYVLGLVTVASASLSALCASNPKACFGSCPTFYARSGPELPLMAEGFSASVSRPMEDTDVDALVGAEVEPGGGFVLHMKNEALETHFVRSLRVGVVDSHGVRVLREGDSYRPAARVHEPRACEAVDVDDPSGERRPCQAEVARSDGLEYVSRTDGKDLGTTEAIRVVFPHRPGPLGVVVRARNTLLNTFLFYQSLAYMGRSIGDYLLAMERTELGVAATKRFLETLGGIEAEVRTAHGFQRIGSFTEIGPIARDVQLWSLPNDLPEGDIELRLTVRRGNYKIDELALAELLPALEPTWLQPDRVEKDGALDPAALASLQGQGPRLMTFPGDTYAIHFPVKALERPALFLESRGYYYEWGRESWLADEDPEKLRMLFEHPRQSLIELAPAYHRIEAKMDAVFFNSRITHGP